MVFAELLLTLTLLSQTKIDTARQAKGTNIRPNLYFTTATLNGDVQLLPGIFFTRLMQVENATPPPSSASVCGVAVDGQPHQAYEFARPGSVILSDTHMYVCLTTKKWKRISMEVF